jgi:hypothetical protein
MKNNQQNNEIIIYEGGNGQPRIEVRIQGETVWLNQAQLADLFSTSRPNATMHIKNIFKERELVEDSVCKDFLHTAADGKKYNIKYYNLDLIISLGYRIKSDVATRFRQWATTRLKEYIMKGFAMDDDRLKEMGGGGYWKELLVRIRDIRSSEKVFYRQILDIYATSIDYDASADTSVEFFKKVQNKVHYAVHRHTAAEIIYSRADAEKEFMGLTTFQGARPHLTDAVIAKNYLSEKELRALGQIVSGYLDFAERQAEREAPMKMEDWADHLDAILTATGEQLLPDAGKISHEKAVKKAGAEYKEYQAKTLSPVEKAYLDTIRNAQKKIEKKVKDSKSAKNKKL